MSNALELESMLAKGCRGKINVFQLGECFLGLSVRVERADAGGACTRPSRDGKQRRVVGPQRRRCPKITLILAPCSYFGVWKEHVGKSSTDAAAFASHLVKRPRTRESKR